MNKHMIKPLLSVTVLIAALSGCASGNSRIAADGDNVDVRFTCRLPNGELAASTDADAAKNAPASRIYVTRTISDPVTVVAGHPRSRQLDPTRTGFESEISERLATSLVGLKEGATITTELVAERNAGQPEGDKIVRITKVRTRPKELRMTRDNYKNKTGYEAALDQQYIIDPAVPGKVAAISGDEVLIRFAPLSQEVELPFGKGIIREKADQFEIDIQAVPGTLVRSGGLIGRIISVDNGMISVDYGHPFGGEKLRCDVSVAAVKPAENKDVNPLPASKAASGDSPESVEKKLLEDSTAWMKAQSAAAAGTGEAIRSGDLVTTHYTVTLEDGSLVATTLEKTAMDPAVKKVTWYREQTVFGPIELVAGKQEVMPGLGEALVGMKAGDKKNITLSADKAIGMPDPQKMQQLPCSQTFPVTIRMPADEYVKRFSAFPTLDKEVELLPYFKSRVTEVTERDVALEFLVADGASFKDSFGTVNVAVTGDRITTTLKPLLGAPFQLKDATGIITATDGTTFTVDLNNPLAGKTIVLDLEAVSVTPAATQSGAVEWIDDYDAGLARAKEEGKPVFLILHADWCGWCKKTFSETIPDPRITALKDRFIWVRVNSDKEQKYKKQFGQEGFPMMVLLNHEGSVLKKIEGYRDARALSEEIRAVLN
jgi:FKBP-type peptidyl-prolyl cis-trans isomerase 2